MISFQEAQNQLQKAFVCFGQGDLDQAMAIARVVLKHYPKTSDAHYLVGLLSLEHKNYMMAEKAFRTASHFNPENVSAYVQLARTFVILGQYSNANIALTKAISIGLVKADDFDVAATVYSMLGDQEEAIDYYSKAIEVDDKPMFRLNRAKTYMFTGETDLAKSDLEKVIALRPKAGMPHWVLSRLEKVSSNDHIQQMESITRDMAPNSPEMPYFQYALGKEYEDLGHNDKAIQAYNAGAKALRRFVEYDEQVEEELFDSLKAAFTSDWLQNQKGQGCKSNAPIFIVGQPRTGTTLVERIIASHSQVHSAGELQQFRLAIRSLAGVSSKHVMDANVIQSIATKDMTELGELYLKISKTMTGDKAHFIDKMPVNYLYAPLIAASLPNAKIIHINRGAADSCVASYKQLFADAYPHSYDQGEMARHHILYRQLMEHYRTIMGDQMLDIHYEDVVSNTETEARKIIEFLDLEWEEACLEFHKQQTAVTTASAAQVREKAHSRSVGKWKAFESGITEMLKCLEDAGYQ